MHLIPQLYAQNTIAKTAQGDPWPVSDRVRTADGPAGPEVPNYLVCFGA